jgi:hypothetical protein
MPFKSKFVALEVEYFTHWLHISFRWLISRGSEDRDKAKIDILK